MDSREQDPMLVRQMLEGSESAFTELYRRHQARVFRFALHMSGSRALAEEVVQEVFLAFLKDPARYVPERGNFGLYLLGMAKNYVLRMLHRTRDEDLEQADGPAAGDDPADGLARRQTIENIRKAVLSLPPGYREAVVLCDLEEMDYAEAAQVLDCAVGTVRSRLHRARAMLAERIRNKPELRDELSRFKVMRCLA